MTQPSAEWSGPQIWPSAWTRRPDLIRLSWPTVCRATFVKRCHRSQMDCRKSHDLRRYSAHYSCSQRDLTRLSLRQGSPPRLARQNDGHPLVLAYAVSLSFPQLSHRPIDSDHLALGWCFLGFFQSHAEKSRSLVFDCRRVFDCFVERASFWILTSQLLV